MKKCNSNLTGIFVIHIKLNILLDYTFIFEFQSQKSEIDSKISTINDDNKHIFQCKTINYIQVDNLFISCRNSAVKMKSIE